MQSPDPQEDNFAAGIFFVYKGNPLKKNYYPSSPTLPEYVWLQQTCCRKYRREPADLPEVLHDMPEL